ncbi:MAG: class I poly(R)-hydroxyalkanoic acid synthase [Betaproteobacteria bacterium HGW-Betaproteobacteria-11]|nr:MAG: class I poly(R)-hydroxyalkanoic acid synthase [Betaproteobacteria bacterium HGW-Betaproteobacteria-11]
MQQAGEVLMQGFGQLLAAQAQNAQGTAPGVAFPGMDTEALKSLQQGWMARHQQLWQAMLNKAPDQPAPQVVSPEPGDKRFSGLAWSESPIYDYLRQAYLLNADYMRQTVEITPVADGKAKDRMRFMTRQIIDALAPSNFVATNPEFVRTALDTQGESIRQGIQNLLADLEKGRISMTDDAAFEVGSNLANTPGAVVFENALFQLIQYSPLTETVARRPFLLVPPCINKFYILDLQPENSFVRYAVEQGNTVFMISWRNVKEDLGQLTWDDYIEQGVLTALRTVNRICGSEQSNVLGFCVGGTLLASALAVACARGENPAASLTLLTTLLDFSDAGELGCLVDEASVATREATIGKGGLLRGSELASVFSALRANDLIWNYVVGNYLKGNKPPAFDLLYWNSDATNLPGPFLAWYLRNMYLENNLRVPGKLEMCGVKADLGRIDMPAFLFASREDHIVPWQTSYLGRRLLGSQTTFVLGASGHIAGPINPASKNKRSYWLSDSDSAVADNWLAASTEVKGSWWPHWTAWLKQYADGEMPARGRLGSADFPPIEPAPGRYVKEKA